jgi:ATP-binding cassette subfamily B protein
VEVEYINYKFQPIIKNQIISEALNFILGSSQQFFQDNLSGRISEQIMTLAENIELLLHRISLDFIRGVSRLGRVRLIIRVKLR